MEEKRTRVNHVFWRVGEFCPPLQVQLRIERALNHTAWAGSSRVATKVGSLWAMIFARIKHNLPTATDAEGEGRPVHPSPHARLGVGQYLRDQMRRTTLAKTAA